MLGQSPVREGVTPRDPLLETIERTSLPSATGDWLAKHHGAAGLTTLPLDEAGN